MRVVSLRGCGIVKRAGFGWREDSRFYAFSKNIPKIRVNLSSFVVEKDSGSSTIFKTSLYI
jgi:hypothetical protein